MVGKKITKHKIKIYGYSLVPFVNSASFTAKFIVNVPPNCLNIEYTDQAT